MQTCRPACRTRTSGPEPRFWVTLILSWRKPFKIVILPHQYFSSWASLFLLSISKCFKCIATHDVTVPHCTTFHRYTPRIHKMRFRICKQLNGWRDGESGGRTKCQPDIMPTKGSVPTFWLAFCPDHLNMFWHFFQIPKIIFQITFHKIAKWICQTGSDDSSWGQIESAFEELFSMRKSIGNKLTQFADFFSWM